jgi:hypothetical protein
LLSGSNEIADNEAHDLKHDSQRTFTVRGTRIDCNDEFVKARDSIRVSSDLFPNEIVDNASHNSKQDLLRIFTLRGTIIDRSDNFINARDSIIINLESFVNKTFDKVLHDKKHASPRVSTSTGIATSPHTSPPETSRFPISSKTKWPI